MNKKLSYVLGLFLLAFAVIMSEKIITFFIVDNTESYSRLTLHEMYSQKENIDVLFLGASHCYQGINTEIMDTRLGKNTFNLGTSAQTLDGSYYILKEALKENEIESLYLEVDNMLLHKETGFGTSTYLLTDYMKPSLNKVEYMVKMLDEREMLNAVFMSRRVMEDPPIDRMAQIAEKKVSKEFRNYEYFKTAGRHYAGKGFVYTDGEVNPDVFQEIPEEYLLINDFDQDEIAYLEKIINLCKDDSIEIFLFTAPMPAPYVEQCVYYQNGYQWLKKFADDSDVSYHDFNIEENESLELTMDCFEDWNHLNGKGADIFTSFYADFILQNEGD